MIKAAGKTGSGAPLLLLGISGENVARLVAGEPIYIRSRDLTELGLPLMEVVLCYGRTEADIVNELRGLGVAIEGT